jgi:hydroxylamine reductase (hybrid-cluster protein)
MAGVTNIRLGPRMPAFLTPEATAILVDRFNIKPADIGSPENDLKQMMQNQ